MLDKIIFENGKSVSRAFLDEIQKGTSFAPGSPREDYYEAPSDSDEASWQIHQRDGIKDWEIADPRKEPESALGRLANDGIVLNNYNPSNFDKVWGPPALRETSVGSGVFGVWVEAGKFISSSGQPIAWSTQFVQLVSTNAPNFIYIDEESALEDIDNNTPVQLSIAPTLPSVSLPHIPLAQVSPAPGGTSLAVGLDGKVAGAGYVDLRPGLYVGNLNSYPRTLRNTQIIGSSYNAQAWERVVANTAAGSLVVQTPVDPTDSDRFAVVDISATFNEYPIIIRPSPGQQINGSVDDWIINVKDAHIELFYNEETSQWKFEETPGGDCNPLLGTFLSCGGREFIGVRTALECPDGEKLPAIFPDVPEGVYYYEVNTSKCYRQFYETVSLYSNGEGGLITVANAPRCARDGVTYTSAGAKNIVYVDGSIGDDSLPNTGSDPARPFRTLERAVIEGVRESRRSGIYNDRFDRLLIKIAPGDYYVDNSPGSNSIPGLTQDEGLVQRVTSSFVIEDKSIEDRITIITIDSGNTNSNQPPLAFNLGRVIYSEQGGVGNIVKVKKRNEISSLWDIYIEYVTGSWNIGDEVYYDNLSAVNPTTGGIIIPRGMSISGEDLRKVRIHPMYVPDLDPVESNPQALLSAIFKVTGGVYVSDLTFTDNLQFSRTHNTLTSVTFASEKEIFGGVGETSYYAKLNSLFAAFDGWAGDGLEALDAETTIVAPVAGSKTLRHVDAEENATGLPESDSREDAPISFPGPLSMVFAGSGDPAAFALPDINAARSSSPYIYNCSVRSIFGLKGLHADGALVAGFKSMVTANFTQVSLQVDPNCFVEGTYYLDPPVSKSSGIGKQYRSSPADPLKYRHFGFRASNDGFIQVVSCFVIGNADHFFADSGGDVSITNSCSDFGDISLRARGYKNRAFSQDEGVPGLAYAGTRLLEIIPPLPLSYSALPNGREATLKDQEVNTALVLELEKTQDYILANKTIQDTVPPLMRYYVRNADLATPFTLDSPPKAKSLAFGQYSYTTKLLNNTYVLSGGSGSPNRKRFYVTGFDENSNSILYAADITVAPTNGPGWDRLDDDSKIFVWDAGLSCWYVNVTTAGIVEEATDLDGDGFLLKRLDYAFRYKLISSPTSIEANLAGINYIFDGANIRVIRAEDTRTGAERVYKVVLDGFAKENGLRKPQPFYVLEKQVSESGYPLNGSTLLQEDPLIISEITPYDQYLNPSFTGLPVNPGKFTVVMVQGSEGRSVLTGDYFPTQNFDEPELTEDPSASVTKVAVGLLFNRPGVYFSEAITPSVNPIEVKTSAGASSTGFLVGLRRPSIIRSSGHTWEWSGYLNYDTALPIFQGDPLEQDTALGKLLVEERGGRVYASGMNEEGNYYIGTTVFDLRSGEQFSIPVVGSENSSQTNQVFNGVVIRNTLQLRDNSDAIFGNNTDIFFSSSTRFKSLTSGDITASPNPPLVYASTTRAGLVQLATTAAVRGALGQGANGISDKLAVTAGVLATELRVRFENIIQPGPGIKITTQSVDVPGGDPLDESDNITQFIVESDDQGDFGGYVPIGGIMMWTGVTAPNNYALCDGANGTPDLRNRFVVGAGGAYAIAATGGSDTVTLTTPQIPAHDHSAGASASSSSSGSHSHTGTAASAGSHSHSVTDPGHSHSYTQPALVQNASADGFVDWEPFPASSNSQTAGATTGISIASGGAHTHTVTITSSGAHTHDVSVALGAVGGGEAHENRPPYYALAFIQRIR